MTARWLNVCKGPALVVLLLAPGAATWGDELQRLLKLSGLVEQVALIPEQVGTSMIEQFQVLPEPQRGVMVDAIQRTVEEALAPEVMMTGLTERLSGAVGANNLTGMIDWYRSELGRRITEAEVSGSSRQATERIMASSDSLLSDTRRVALARSIDELAGGTDGAMDVIEVMQVALLSVAAGTAEPGFEPDALREEIRLGLESVRPEVERHTLATYVYMYQGFSEQEIERYRGFLARPEVRRFGDQVSAAMLGEWQRAFAVMARNLAGALGAIQVGLDSA